MKNHKKIILVCCILFATVAQAQLKFGIQGGVDVASHSFKLNTLDASNRMGFQIGPKLELGIPLLGLGVDGALLYGYKAEVKGSTSTNKIASYDYLSIPINLKKRFSFTNLFGIYFSAGPYANIKLNGGDLTYADANNAAEAYKSESFEMGMNFGLGVNLLRHLDLGMAYGYKLTDNYKQNPPTVGDLFKRHEKRGQ